MIYELYVSTHENSEAYEEIRVCYIPMREPFRLLYRQIVT
jgi:hypothetical protein